MVYTSEGIFDNRNKKLEMRILFQVKNNVTFKQEKARICSARMRDQNIISVNKSQEVHFKENFFFLTFTDIC